MKIKIKLKTLALSVVTSALLVGCGGGGGSSSSDTTTTSDLSGNIVDGYVKGATVTIGEYTTTTDEKGHWSILNVESASNFVLKARGGIDTATGEVFEGVLKAPVPSNPQEKITVTPLSTVVASVVESGKSVQEATQAVAKSLGVSEDALTADPIERLANGTPAQKAEAATVIKKSLVVQKMAETITKSTTTDETHQDKVFDAVMDSVAKALTDTTTDINFDEVIADTKTITDKVVTQIKEDKTIVIENLEEKLEASIESASQVVEMVQAIDENELSLATDTTQALEITSKAIEVVTSTVEKAVESIATATDVNAIEVAKTKTKETNNALVMLGGVDGIATKLEEQSVNLDDSQTLDASDFTESFLSDEVIQTQADTFNTLVEAGMNEDMIAEVGIKVATTKDANPDIIAIVQEVVTKAEDEGHIEKGSVDTTTVSSEVESAVEVADEAATTAGEVAIVVDDTVTDDATDDTTKTEDTPTTDDVTDTVETPTTGEDATDSEEDASTDTEITDETSTASSSTSSSSSSSAPTVSLSYSLDTFIESSINNGSTTTSAIITLSNDTFKGDNNAELSGVTVTNVPNGMSAVVTKTSDTTATLTLSGNAISHTDNDDVSNLTVTFSDDAFTKTKASSVQGATKSDLKINFIDADTKELSYSTATFSEAAANDGSITATSTITLVGDTFTGSVGQSLEATVTNLPAGLTAVIKKASDTTATLSFTGSAVSHANADDVNNLKVEFANSAFVGNKASDVIGSTKSDLAIDFADPVVKTLSYSTATFSEAAANDGSITATSTITLVGDTFTGSVGQSLEATVTNLPAGLTAVIKKASDTTATLSFTGSAVSHANSDDVSSLTIAFSDTAFVNSSATDVTGSTKSDLVIDFEDNVDKTISYSRTYFTESYANDGSVTVTSTITLAGDKFTGTNGDDIAGVVFANVPSGLNAVVKKVSDTTATLSFTGKAGSHDDVNDIDSVAVEFANSSFVGGSAIEVTGYANNNISIDFAALGATINGDTDANIILGSGANDIIYGLGGADNINGDAGNDSIDVSASTTGSTITISSLSNGVDTVIGFVAGSTNSTVIDMTALNDGDSSDDEYVCKVDDTLPNAVAVYYKATGGTETKVVVLTDTKLSDITTDNFRF